MDKIIKIGQIWRKKWGTMKEMYVFVILKEKDNNFIFKIIDPCGLHSDSYINREYNVVKSFILNECELLLTSAIK